MANQGSRIVYQVGCLLHAYGRFFTIYGWRFHFWPPPGAGQPRGQFDRWVDMYVLGWITAAVAAYVIVCSKHPHWLHVAVVVISLFSILRVVEIPAFHLEMLLTGTGGGGLPTVASHRRSLLLFLINYLEIIVWFAVYYSLLSSYGALQVEWCRKPRSKALNASCAAPAT
jgi:hypothetical protein